MAMNMTGEVGGVAGFAKEVNVAQALQIRTTPNGSNRYWEVVSQDP
jgi:hypothetical protein